jgi:tetratricopeptide (TPR) repeat protein
MKSNLADLVESFVDSRRSSLRDLDLLEYIRETDEVDSSPAERLRQLAIYLDENAIGPDEEYSWPLVRRIYERASEIDPGDALVLNSWGISALMAAHRQADPALRKELLVEAGDVQQRAWEIDPANADVAYARGLALYEDHSRGLDEALGWFRRAVSLKHDHAMAQMYIGHCRQDVEDWRGALQAYLDVDQGALAREWPQWRLYDLKMMIGSCYLKLHNRDAALEVFSRILDDLQKIVESGEDPWEHFGSFDKLVDAASGDMKIELFDRAAKYVPQFLDMTSAIARR